MVRGDGRCIVIAQAPDFLEAECVRDMPFGRCPTEKVSGMVLRAGLNIDPGADEVADAAERAKRQGSVVLHIVTDKLGTPAVTADSNFAASQIVDGSLDQVDPAYPDLLDKVQGEPPALVLSTKSGLKKTKAQKRGSTSGSDRSTNYESEERYTRSGLDEYRDSIASVPLLTAREEVELSRIIEAGNSAQARMRAGITAYDDARASRAGVLAKEKIILANQRLVYMVAERYWSTATMQFLEVIQEGNIGLALAVDSFDWRKGNKFATFAKPKIRSAILRALEQKKHLVRLPSREFYKHRAALRDHNDDRDTIGGEAGRQDRLTAPTSLDVILERESEDINEGIIADPRTGPEEEALEGFNNYTMEDLLDLLTPRERLVLELRYDENGETLRTYAEIGELLDCTGSNVHAIEKRIKNTLRTKGLTILRDLMGEDWLEAVS